MALLTVQDVGDGGAVTLAAAAVGDQIPQGTRGAGWDLGVFLLVRNASGIATRDVTVTGFPLVTVPISGTAVIPAHGIYFGHARDITYSAVADLTVAAVRMAGE